MSIKNDINKILLKKFLHLEISVVKYSEVQTDNESKRIDSEYFKQEYLENKKFICKNEYKTLEQLSTKITNGHTPYGENLSHNEIKFITAEFMEDFFIKEVKKFISYESHTNYLKRSILKNGDIIFSIKGKIGNAVPIFNIKEPLNINQDIARISINRKEINIFYLSAFLNSKFGKKQTEQEATGQINPFIPLGTLKQIKIRIFPKEFQIEIEAMVKDSHKALENSKKLYKEAEKILYEALGLDAENPLESILSFREKNKVIHNHLKGYKRLNISIRTYKESYLKTGRLDAEYYQEKFRKNEILIKNFSHAKLSDLVNIQKSIEPGSEAYQDDGIEFIRVANLGKFELSKSYIYLDKIKFINELERLYPQKDMILLTKDGSIGIAYCVPENLNCITSAAILHLKIKDKNIILPQVLTLIINSIIGQLQAQRDSGGAIISHWTISEIENILIPLLDLKTQRKIEAKVKQSFELRDKSKELLENAKVKIENAIIDS